MKYWIYKDGLQRGPFTIEELADMKITPETPVWYEGLPDWITAKESPGLAPLLTVRTEGGNDRPLDVDFTDMNAQAAEPQVQPWVQELRSQAAAAPTNTGETEDECPSTYMFWSIVSTLCCCLPMGLAAIFFSAKVKPRWVQGDARGAHKASDTAQLLIMLAITLGVLLAPLSFLL